MGLFPSGMLTITCLHGLGDAVVRSAMENDAAMELLMSMPQRSEVERTLSTNREIVFRVPCACRA